MSRLTYQGTNICQITTLTQAVTEKANSLSAAAAQSCRWLQQGQEGRAWRGGGDAEICPGDCLRKQVTDSLVLTP